MLSSDTPMQAGPGKPGGPSNPDQGRTAPSEPTTYRHDVDLRFVTPRWLGRIYFDLRIGKDIRQERRPLALPRAVRRHNRVAAAVLAQMAISWVTAVIFLGAFLTQIGCGSQVVDITEPTDPSSISGPAGGTDTTTEPTGGGTLTEPTGGGTPLEPGSGETGITEPSGGEETTADPGELTFSVVWPEVESRLIPTAAQSIVLVVTDMATKAELGRAVLTRTNTSATLGSLPAWHSCLVAATARPNLDGSGIAQAMGSQIVTIPSGSSVAVSLTLATTITAVQISAPRTQMTVGSTATFVPTAKDTRGNIVLVSNAKWSWQASPSTVARVDANGLVTALAPGTASVTVTDLESGKSASLGVTVPTPGMSVTPTSLDFGTATTALTIEIAGTGGASPAWTCTPGASWLTVSKSSGTGAATVTIEVDRAGMAIGAHTSTVQVVSSVGTKTVTVKVTQASGGLSIGVS